VAFTVKYFFQVVVVGIDAIGCTWKETEQPV